MELFFCNVIIKVCEWQKNRRKKRQALLAVMGAGLIGGVIGEEAHLEYELSQAIEVCFKLKYLTSKIN